MRASVSPNRLLGGKASMDLSESQSRSSNVDRRCQTASISDPYARRKFNIAMLPDQRLDQIRA